MNSPKTIKKRLILRDFIITLLTVRAGLYVNQQKQERG